MLVKVQKLRDRRFVFKRNWFVDSFPSLKSKQMVGRHQKCFQHEMSLYQNIVTGRNEVVAKVMFLQASVILSTGGFPAGRAPLGRKTPLARRPPRQGDPLASRPPQAGRPPLASRPPGQGDPPGRENPPGWETPLARRPPGRKPPVQTPPPPAYGQ